VTILEALRDRQLFGGLAAFRDLSTWRSWLVFLSALYGLPLDAGSVALFRKHTGRGAYAPPPGGWREAVAVVGRQSGKSTVVGTVVAYESAMRGQRGTLGLLVAQDERSVRRTLFNYAREPFRSLEILRAEVQRETADAVELRSGVTLACYPCRPAAVRGVRAGVVGVDELAYFVSTEGNRVDSEMLTALRPTLATTGGKLLILSSPYGQSGALWDLHRQHFGRDDSPVLVWQASAPEMNPTLPADYLARMAEDDPEAYRSEVLGEFRAGIASLFDAGALEAVVVPERRELPPVDGARYWAFVDPSGGRSDAFTVAIGHAFGERAVVDVVRAWPSPFNPSGVVAEAAALLRAYRVREVVGDRYGGEWPAEAFRAHRIAYTVADKPKGDLYLELLATVNSGHVELPDVPDLLRELRGLERRRGMSGRDRVDHRPGGHDDRANAVAGVAFLLRQKSAAGGTMRVGVLTDEEERDADEGSITALLNERF
jgi:hypothetical protein